MYLERTEWVFTSSTLFTEEEVGTGSFAGPGSMGPVEAPVPRFLGRSDEGGKGTSGWRRVCVGDQENGLTRRGWRTDETEVGVREGQS